LDWAWLVRVQWQTRVLRRDGSICAIRALVPRPGALWLGHDDPPATRATRDGQPARAVDPEDGAGATGAPVAVFRVTGWRASQVVAAWPVGETEPWLLVTSLPGTRARLRDYAQRWAIERLFLSWKTHGWGLDTSGHLWPQ
jgi:hypothetical protein